MKVRPPVGALKKPMESKTKAKAYLDEGYAGKNPEDIKFTGTRELPQESLFFQVLRYQVLLMRATCIQHRKMWPNPLEQVLKK